MARTKIDYGIDLGTTNSAIARMENGIPKIMKSDTLKDTIPSCIYFNKKKSTMVGDSAFNYNKRDKLGALKTSETVNSNAFIEFKRTMGTDKKYPSSNMEKDYTSEDLSSEVLKKLKSFVSDEDVSCAVITVPAKFNTSQIDATQKAAELAGYTSHYHHVVKTLKSEILELTQEVLANSAPKAAFKLVEIMDSKKPIIQANNKLAAATTLLDRVGVSKVDRVDVNHNVQSGGIFLMPDKKPLDLDDGDYEELSE